MKLAEKREQMLNMVDQWQQSDQTQKEFANENQIALAKLQYWIRQSRNEQHGEFIVSLRQTASCDLAYKS